MAKATEIVDIIEGFKLGSLGVSKKPVVTTEPEQPKQASAPKPKSPAVTAVRVTETAMTRVPDENWKKVPVPFVRWTSPDKEDQILAITRGPKTGYKWCVVWAGGSVNLSGWDLASIPSQGYEWLVIQKEELSSLEEAKALYKKLKAAVTKGNGRLGRVTTASEWIKLEGRDVPENISDLSKMKEYLDLK